jgi:hypothetical protein
MKEEELRAQWPAGSPERRMGEYGEELNFPHHSAVSIMWDHLGPRLRELF